MPNDSKLDLCGKLIRGLGSFREMFPGSFIERSRKCGKPICRCAEGKQLHQELLLSVVWDKRIGPISVGYPRLRHAGRDIDSLFALGCTIAQRLNRNGVLGSEWAMEAWSPPSMAPRYAVPTRPVVTSAWKDKLERKMDGELRECLQYYFRISAVTLVSTAFPVFRGIRFQQGGQTEVACSLAAVRRCDPWLYPASLRGSFSSVTGRIGFRFRWRGNARLTTDKGGVIQKLVQAVAGFDIVKLVSESTGTRVPRKDGTPPRIAKSLTILELDFMIHPWTIRLA